MKGILIFFFTSLTTFFHLGVLEWEISKGIILAPNFFFQHRIQFVVLIDKYPNIYIPSIYIVYPINWDLYCIFWRAFREEGKEKNLDVLFFLA